MEIFNYALTILFLGAAVWMGKKVFEQRNQITIACKYLNGYRIFIMVCFAASFGLMILGFKDLFDLIRSLAMTTMVGLFLCLREGAGPEGFVYNGSLIPYTAVSHYDYKTSDQTMLVYVVFREKVKDGVEEGTVTLKFNETDRQAIVELLEAQLPKKHKRIKKT